MRSSRKNHISGRKSSSFIGYVQWCIARPVTLSIAMASALLLLSLFQVSTLQPLRLAVWKTVYPLISVVVSPFIALSSVVGNVSDYRQLKTDHARLKKENEKLTEWYHTAQLLKAENASLRSLLNVRSVSDISFVTAQIMNDVSSPYIQSILVAAGKDYGIKEGQVVLSDKGVVGRVVDVQNSVSRVLLLTDINSRIPVMIEGTNQKAVLAGHNFDLPSLEYIPETVTLEKQMRVVTSGDGGVFPSGLPVGVVSTVTSSAINVALFSQDLKIGFVKILQQRGTLEALK